METIATHLENWVLIDEYGHLLTFMLLLECPPLSSVTGEILLTLHYFSTKL